MLDGLFAVCGSCGNPKFAVSTTVPVIGGTFVLSPARLARSCAGVLAGRFGEACAAGIWSAAITAPVTTTAVPGTAQRARRDIVTGMVSSPVPRALRFPDNAYSDPGLL